METALKILQYVKPYKKRAALAILSMAIHSFLTVFFVRVFQEFVETVISDLAEGEEGLLMLTMIAGLMLAVYFFKGLVYFSQKYNSKYVSQQIMRDIREDLYSHLQKLSLSFFSYHKTGELISRLTNDVRMVEKALVKSTVSFLYKLLTVIGGIGYLFYLNARLAVILLLVIPAVAYAMIKLNRKIRGVSLRAQERIADVSDILQETFSGIKEIKSFVREDYELSRFQKQNQADFKARLKNSQYKALLSPLVEFLSALAFTAVLWYGGLEVMRGNMLPSELIAFFAMLLTIINPVRSLTKINATIQQALAAGSRIFETFEYDDIITTAGGGYRSDSISGRVEFSDVTFSYRNDEIVLKKINLTVEQGEAIALVGPSGAGKSTLVDLIPRFYEVDEGEVLIDDRDVKEYDLAWLREQIGIVPQETVLFGGTIEENIAYGDLEADKEEIIEAARAANAHHFVEEFPEGYQTIVGERGEGLSGGQKQRIAIARALLKDPDILIFDEATSSLDAETEQMVQEALTRLMKNRTTFIIAHRLSTIIDVNNIAVMEEGQLIEKGDHETLMEKDQKYANLYRHQLLREKSS